MSIITPFNACIPQKDCVSDVICPPYDVIDTEQARKMAGDNRRSLLWVTKSEIDLPDDTPPYDEAVYEKAAEHFIRLREDGTLVHDGPQLYIYRLTMGDHAQTGVVAGVSVEEYAEGSIRQHERTREEKVVDRTRHSMAVGAHVEPVMLVHRTAGMITELVRRERSEDPLFDVRGWDGVRHELWRVRDPQAFINAFSELDALYIADGHHRSAAALRTRDLMQAQSKEGKGLKPSQFFPAVIFPQEELKVFQYDWAGDPKQRPLAQVTIEDIIKLSDERGIMPPKSTWFAPKLASGFFIALL